MEKPDLDGYPILRIDQLSIIDIPTLQRSVPDAKQLIETLREECRGGDDRSQRSMMKYLQKQLDCTVKEIATREAEGRVNELLSGIKELQVKTIAPREDTSAKQSLDNKQHQQETVGESSTNSRGSVSDRDEKSGDSSPPKKKEEPPPVAFYKPIPLPSQIAAAALTDNEKKQDDSLLVSRSAGSNRRTSGAELLTSRSSGAVQSPNYKDSDASTHLDDNVDNNSSSSNLNSKVKTKRRPRSSDNKPRSIYSQRNLAGASEKQSLLAMEQNFGNAFMVTATEKKKRFVPKKVKQETEEERRAKIREKGRQQAMMRLLERKNKQIERNEALKLRRMEEKNAAAKKRKEAVEKRQKQLEQQRILQRKRALEKEQEQKHRKTNSGGSDVKDVQEEELPVDNDNDADVLSEVDANVSSENESLSGGDDEFVKSVEIPQNEVDAVVQESEAVFDSYRLRNRAMKIDSDSDADEMGVKEMSGGGEKNLEEPTTDDSQRKDTEENENASGDTTVPGVDDEKNKAALSTLRKLKQKKKVGIGDYVVEQSVTESNVNEKEDFHDEGVPDGVLSFDNFQCEEGVDNILFIDQNNQFARDTETKKARKRRKKSRGVDEGDLSGTEEVEGETRKRRKKRKKKIKKIIVNEDGEEVEVIEEVRDDEEKRKSKKKKKKVKKIVINENGEEIEVIEEVDVDVRRKKKKLVKRTIINNDGQEEEMFEEVEVKRKKKKKKGADEELETGEVTRNASEDECEVDGNENEKSSTKKEENSNIVQNHVENKRVFVNSAQKRTTYDSSYDNLNNLFCSFFSPVSIFSTEVEKEDVGDENSKSRTVHLCKKGPDELPGLSAWALTSIDSSGKPVWSVDVKKLCNGEDFLASPRHSTLSQQRSKTRQEYSYGIVLLARVCESLLTGNDFAMAQGDFESRFRSDWQNRVAQFDLIVADLSADYQDTLFKMIVVCGNTAAVVSKLENLVSTAFKHPAAGGYTEMQKKYDEANPESNRDETRKSEVGGSDSTEIDVKSIENGANESSSGDDTESLDESAYDDESDDEYMDHFSGAIDMLKSEGSALGRNNSTDSDLNEEEYMKTLFADEERIAQKNFVDNDDVNSSDNGRNEKAMGSDDESMVLPDSSVVFKNDQPHIEHLNDEYSSRRNNSQDQTSLAKAVKPPKATNSGKATSEIETTSTQHKSDDKSSQNSSTSRRQSAVKRDRSSTSLQACQLAKQSLVHDSNASIEKKVTDVYKSIAEIFPAVRAKMDSMQASCRPGDHAILAKVLLESMHVQLKLYNDWLVVMDDYATVFCSDKEKGVQTLVDENDKNSSVYSGGSAALHYRVKSSRQEVNNIIKDVFGNVLKGWEELPTGLGLGVSWNVLWSWSKPKINMTQLLVWQRINHFQNSKELTRKDSLKKNLQKFTGAMGNKSACQFEIMPQTFLLPAEYTLFVKEFTAQEQEKAVRKASNGKLPPVRNLWIVKPVGLSRGRGISMLSDLSTLTYSQSTVLQKYIDNPLCLDGYKFDLRIYVIVTSFQPLEAFIYRDGFARISTVKYSTDEKSLSNLYIHLTNSSIQKHSENGPSKDNPLHISQGNTDESNGSKIGLLGKNGLWKRLEKYGVDVEPLWEEMCLLIVKSLVAVDDKIPNQPCSFELFGYDILFDENLRPWLIEVNSGPSLARETQLDIRVKNALVTDIIQLLDPAPFDRAALTRVLKKRISDLQQKKFSMTSTDPDLEKDLKTILGSHVPRRYGEEPRNCGNFERLCPGTKAYTTSLKLKSKLVKAPIKK